MSRRRAARLRLAPEAGGARTAEPARFARLDPAVRVARPPLAPGLVERARLMRALAAPDVTLRLLVAPAGYGKTTTLRQWEEHDPRPFAWLTAGAGHGDPVRLLGDVLAAVDELPAARGAAVAELPAPPPAAASIVLPRVARALATRAEPFVLVVDQAELVERRDALEALAGVCELMPDGCVLALAARREPGLPLGRLRAHRAIVELRARDLAMTRGEARQLLRAAGLELGAHHVERLVERTEGWPAGLYLAALALREQDDLDAAVARFAGDDRLVADYLRDELLSQLPDEDVTFLRRVSPLDELSGPLCDAVLGAHGSGAVLRDLARSNLLLTPLDRSEERFHCHALLAEALRADLRRLEPALEARAHRRASDWHVGRDEPERALDHALAAGDAARAARLVWRLLPAHVLYGRRDAVAGWLSRLPAGELVRRPELALAAGLVELPLGDRDRVEHWARVAQERVPAVPAARRRALAAVSALLRAAVARDGLEALEADARHAGALLAEDSPWRAPAGLLEGAAALLSGDGGRGRRLLEDGARRGAMAAPAAQVACLGLLALDDLAADRVEAGARSAELAREQVERLGLREDAGSALVFAVSALANAHRGRVSTARGDVRDARRVLDARRDVTPLLEAAALIALARAELRLGDVLAARGRLAECEPIAEAAPAATTLRAWLEDARARAAAFVRHAVADPSSLTTAELRVLGYLPSHLPLREIADELCVSANTVKTQAHALYRKLDASSRSEAVARAVQLGLLDP